MYDTRRILLGDYPTPVERLVGVGVGAGVGGVDLWVKRDDLTSPIYGGNKVRKLEYVLGEARALGKTRLLTAGAVGSHHVLATATFGRREGFEVAAVLIAQPRTEHAATNLRAELAQGLEAWPSAQLLAPIALARRFTGRGTYFVQVGGSSVLGAMGYVDAARELAAQVRAGQMPTPDLVVVTLGSGGTAAGLAAGFELEDLPTKILAVAVVDPPQIFASYTHYLARRCVELAGGKTTRARIAARLATTTRFLGKGYGWATDEGARATERAAAAGLALDPTYTAKAFAATLARLDERREKTVLYWHTLSSAPIAPLLEGAPADVPAALDRLLR